VPAKETSCYKRARLVRTRSSSLPFPPKDEILPNHINLGVLKIKDYCQSARVTGEADFFFF